MTYFGDADEHDIGVTTENILINTVGEFDYLVLNRELGNDTPNHLIDNEQRFLHTTGAGPVIKYWVHGFKGPKFVKIWMERDYPKDGDNDKFN